MRKEISNAIYNVEVVTVPLFFLLSQFTIPQKKWLRKRDGYHCQLPMEHNCGVERQIHHIIPQSVGRREKINVDYPENAVLVCQEAHRLIHDDERYHNIMLSEIAKRNTRRFARKGIIYPRK